MGKLFHFISYNNAVPIAVSFLLLGAATTYAATNPKAIIDKQDQVVSIDNTYIAHLDFNRFTPTVKILSVDEDSDAYYVQYVFSTVDLIDSVWSDVTTNETLTVEKSSLGTYRDLGLFVTKQLREKIEAEVKRLKETQVIEKKQITQKTIVTKYKGLVGGFLDEKHETIAGYTPVIKPPKASQEVQTFARPDPNAPKKVVPPPIEIPAETPVVDPLNQDVVNPADIGVQATTTPPLSTTTTTGSTTDSNGGSTASSTPDVIPNDAPTLAILGDNPVEIFVGAMYVDLGAVVTDDHDTDLSIQIYVDGSATDKVTLNTSAPKQYTITYESTDSEGAVAQVQRIVVVKAKETVATSTPSSATSTSPSNTQATTTPIVQPKASTTPPVDPQPPVVQQKPVVPNSVTSTTSAGTL